MKRTASMRRSGPALLVAVALLSTAACGSTVQSASGTGNSVLEGPAAGAGTDGLGGAGADGLVTDGGLSGDGLSAPADDAAGASAPGAPSAGGTDAGGSTTTGQGPDAGSAGGAGGDNVAAPATGGSIGPGTSATEIRLGIPYCNDCAAANGAVGASQNDPGDTRRYYRAALEDVNARGGVLGRKLVPVFHEISVADNLDASAQAACETWTTDATVAAMFGLRGDVFYSCAKKAGVMVVGGGGTQPVFDRYPNLLAPASIRLEGLFEKTVDAMVQAGWHKPDTTWPTGKIGLITWESPEYEYAMKNGYLKGLAANGLKEDDVRYIAVPQSASALADASAAISSAVLSFRQKGIDHVLIGDGPAGIFAGAGLTLLFLQNAKSQDYYPRYGFNTNNSPDFDSHPKDQLVGMLAIDGFDSERENDEGIELNPARERCIALMAKKGLPVGDELTRLLASNACEIAFFSEAIFSKAGGTFLDRVIPAAPALGTSYRSPLTYGVRFAGARRDGLYLFRNLRFDEGCGCVKYTSKPYEP